MTVDIKPLIDAADWWEAAGYVASAVVVIGILVESVELAKHIRAKTLHEKRFELIGILVVVLGLAGEIVTQVQSNNRTGLVIGALNAEASDANKAANDAAKSAAELGVKVNELPSFVAQKEGELSSQIIDFKGFVTEEKQNADRAISDLSQRQAELTKARNDAVTAANNAESDIAKAEDALTREAAIRDQIIAINTPRTILPAKQNEFVQLAKRFNGISANVYTPVQNDADAGPLGTLLVSLLTKAEWKVGFGTPSMGWAKTVIVCIGGRANEKVLAAARAIVLSLRANGINSNLDTGTGPDIPMSGFASKLEKPDMTILVGSKQ